MNILKIYEYALQREYAGRDFFREHAGRFSHAAVTGAFEKLANEEEKHIKFIQALIEQWNEEKSAVAQGLVLEREGFFSERATSELLDQTIIESMVPDLSVLRMAYLIERDFAEFYETAAGWIKDEEAKRSLLMLARWERQHEALFKEMHDRAFKEYAGMPWGG